MRSPQNVLESLSSKACNSNYRYQRLYRNLYNPEFYLIAYQKIQAKQGNMTAGTDGKTVDGIGMKRINAFAKPTNVDTNSRILCYDIRDLGKQLLPVGMLVVLDSVFNRIIRNRRLGRSTWVYIDEIYVRPEAA